MDNQNIGWVIAIQKGPFFSTFRLCSHDLTPLIREVKLEISAKLKDDITFKVECLVSEPSDWVFEKNRVLFKGVSLPIENLCYVLKEEIPDFWPIVACFSGIATISESVIHSHVRYLSNPVELMNGKISPASPIRFNNGK